MVWLPTASVVVAKVAMPADRVDVPSAVAPSLKVTVPVGVPPVLPTVAVNVTASPKLLGFFDEASDVVVVADR